MHHSSGQCGRKLGERRRGRRVHFVRDYYARQPPHLPERNMRVFRWVILQKRVIALKLGPARLYLLRSHDGDSSTRLNALATLVQCKRRACQRITGTSTR